MPTSAPRIARQAARGASISEAIAGFATGTPREAMAESARHVLRLSLLDWLAVAQAGRDEPVSRIVRDLVAAEGGAPEAGLIGHPVKLPARAAALANGATSHALDYDDTHFGYLGHPSVAVLPAALALAEKLAAGGAALLDAALVGVESACRIGVWLGRGHYQQGFHQTATSGCFGAAMAAARLLRLDRARACHALGIAATRASGLKSQFGTMGKPYHAGMAAANGLEAACLAAAGFVSNPRGLECQQGFAATHAGEAGDGAGLFEGLGRSFLFEAVQHKFHACCHGTHAALEALIAARDACGLVPGGIRSVTVTVHPRYLDVCNIAAPATGLEAKFSYRMTAAMVLAGRDTGSLATFSDEACRDPDLVALRDLVTVATDPAMSDSAAAIAVERSDGTRLERHHDLEQRLAPAEREAKVRAKAAGLLGREAAEATWQAIGSLGDRDEGFRLEALIKR